MTTTSVGLVPSDGGAVVEPQRLPGIQAMPKQRLFIRDLISPGRTASPAISYVRQTGFTNNARVVSEGTDKPYSDISFDVQFTPVATIAHMFKASKQIMDDFAQLQSTIDTELRYGLKYAEEREILLGDGTGIHLNGIIPQATAYSHAFVVTDMTPIDDLRLALLQSQLARLPANAFVLHFIDWARIELTKDSQGRYILANPQSLLGPTLWGCRWSPPKCPTRGRIPHRPVRRRRAALRSRGRQCRHLDRERQGLREKPNLDPLRGTCGARRVQAGRLHHGRAHDRHVIAGGNGKGRVRQRACPFVLKDHARQSTQDLHRPRRQYPSRRRL
jgi:hypothetical protein